MLPSTAVYKTQIGLINKYEDKIAFLKDKYKGENCFIIAPGPSSRASDLHKIQNQLDTNLVFCIKGVYEKFHKSCDFHFINDCNIPKHDNFVGYRYNVRNEPIIVSSSGFNESSARQRVGGYQRWDIFCQVLDPALYPSQNMGYILENENFDDGLFDKTYHRPCGPSLTFETVIYMALHLGVKKIFAIGLDGGTKWKNIVPSNTNNLIHLDSAPKTQQELEFKNWEIDITNTGTNAIYHWLKEKGTDLFLISDCSNWSSIIPRINAQQIEDIL